MMIGRTALKLLLHCLMLVTVAHLGLNRSLLTELICAAEDQFADLQYSTDNERQDLKDLDTRLTTEVINLSEIAGTT